MSTLSSPLRTSLCWILFGVIAALAMLLPGCRPVEAPRLRILAASSLEPIAGADPSDGGSEISVGASSVLAMQVIAGATADVVLLADPRWMDELEATGVVVSGSRIEIARNRLVLAVPRPGGPGGPGPTGRSGGIPDGRLAIAEPRNVPLGRYTMETLESLGWWSGLENRVVLASDAKAVLALVESGEVDAGIVYASDASRSERIDVVRIFDRSLHRPIRCEAARLSDREASRVFMERLQGPSGRSMVEAAGFEPPGPAGGSEQP